jgi:hypothetical protein
MYYHLMRTTYSAHLILPNLITLTMFSEQCKLQSSSLHNVLRHSVSSSFLGPNIVPSTLFSKRSQSPLGRETKIHIIIVIINDATAQSWALASLTGFVTVRYITMWVISPTINLILVILIQPPETSSGEATTDI